MNSMEETLVLTRRRSFLEGLIGLVTAPRFLVYCGCTLAALLTSYHLGKDMGWDTLDYHFYAGFSALHDRFGQDYFPAGAQSYLNPYVYAPLYLLATSGLNALEVALVLAFVQSVILWLVYELYLVVAPQAPPRVHLGLGICVIALAYANPILIAQFGSSFADILTAEVVVAGWLLLLGAVRAPSGARIVCAGLLLGFASALKLTNALHAVSAGVMVLFVPVSWRSRFRWAALFVVAGIAGFAVVAAPWALRLQENFGNPFFPLLNGIFHSPEFTTARIVDYRFIPSSLAAALWRPFAMVAPLSMVHVEWAAPDLRYALLLVVAALSFLAWGWKRRHGNAAALNEGGRDSAGWAVTALGAGFLVDWSLWLMGSANSRYFIPMACVAAVLGVVLLQRLCEGRPKLRNYLLLAVFFAQFYQLYAGTQYPGNLPWWRDEPWFQVSVPASLADEPALYFSTGIQSNSFIAPYLAPGSGFINLEGDYTLGPGGANGRRIAALIRRYSPHLRVLMRDVRRDAGHHHDLPQMANQNDALEPFGLQLDASDCTRIVVQGISSPALSTFSGRAPPKLSPSDAAVGYFISCRVVPETTRDPVLVATEGAANLTLDRLEDACPRLFQPRRPVTFLLESKPHAYVWVREYMNTDMVAWVSWGRVHFQRRIGGGKEGDAGPESAWVKGPLGVTCERGADGYLLRVIGSH